MFTLLESLREGLKVVPNRETRPSWCIRSLRPRASPTGGLWEGEVQVFLSHHVRYECPPMQAVIGLDGE